MVAAALGSLCASPAMAVVKLASAKAKVQPDSPIAWDTYSPPQVDNPRAWEAPTSGGAIPLGFAGKLADNKPVQHRMVIDFSVVNSHTEPDPYPVPLLHEQGLVLAGNACYMSPDICKGFWQIPLHEDSQKKINFITPEDVWKRRGITEACCNATAHFVGVMNHVLGPLIGEICVVYVDDIVIFAQSGQELVQRARMVLERLRRHDMYASAGKSVYFHH